MIIVIYAKNSSLILTTIISKLTKLLPKSLNVKEIINIFDFDYLIKYTKRIKETYLVIPLTEENCIEVKDTGINLCMPSIEAINTFMSKISFRKYVKENKLDDYTPKTYSDISEISHDLQIFDK